MKPVQSQKKKHSLLISFLAVAFITSFVIFIFFNPFQDKQPEDKGKLTTISTKKLSEIVNSDGENYIYVGRPTCPYCAKFQPVLEETIHEKNIPVYYYNTDNARKNDNISMFDELMGELQVESVPLILLVEDGKVIDRYQPTDDSNPLDEWMKKL